MLARAGAEHVSPKPEGARVETTLCEPKSRSPRPVALPPSPRAPTDYGKFDYDEAKYMVILLNSVIIALDTYLIDIRN